MIMIHQPGKASDEAKFCTSSYRKHHNAAPSLPHLKDVQGLVHQCQLMDCLASTKRHSYILQKLDEIVDKLTIKNHYMELWNIHNILSINAV